MYQNDLAELRIDEVDWKAGTITRHRSKTRERNGQVVTYKILATNTSQFRADDVVIVDGTQGLEAASIQVNQVVTNGTESASAPVKPDVAFMLEQDAEDDDRSAVYCARIEINVAPGAAGGRR